MKYTLRHTTRYLYQEPVSLSHHRLCLTPRGTPFQRCLSFDLDSSPGCAVNNERQDYFGNQAIYISVMQPYREFSVTSRSVVEVDEVPAIVPKDTPPWEEAVRQVSAHTTEETRDAYQFVFPSRFVPVENEFRAFAEPSFPPDRPLLEGVMDLTGRIFDEFTYDSLSTEVSTPVDEVLQNRKGVCQDFAHLQIACLRSLGIAARYVSGYLNTLPPPGQEKLIGADASHAWLSVYVPGFRWVDVDPTNNVVVGTDHITLAWGRDYDEVSPLKGVTLGGGAHTLGVSVDVNPQREDSAAPSQVQTQTRTGQFQSSG